MPPILLKRENAVLVVLFAVFVVFSTAQPQQRLPKIECGQSSVFLPPGNRSYLAESGDFPWLVKISIANGEYMCTGSIISNEWVLSAAKCFLTNESRVVFTGDVIVHVNDVTSSIHDDNEMLVAVDRIVIHPFHEEISAKYNFALLHLNDPLTFSDTVKPICLIDDCADENAPNSVCTLGGWGSDHVLFNESVLLFDQLQKSNLPLVDRKTCQSTLALKDNVGDIELSDDMTCAGYEGGYVDDCRGDAGGPLVCRSDADNTYYLHGINSFGYGCYQPAGYYHIFARPCQAMPWIRNVTGYDRPSAPLPPWATSSFTTFVEGNFGDGNKNNSSTFGTNSNNNGTSNNNNNAGTAVAINSQPAVVNAIARKVPRLLLTSDDNGDELQCGQNKYNMMAVGTVTKSRPALILEYPWQVRIEISSFDTVTPFTCAGSLIHDYWILTSARCVLSAKDEGMTSITAHFGEYDLMKPTANEKSVPVLTEFIHPSYDRNNYDYDFALLRLTERVRFTDSTRPICLLADCDVRPEDDKPAGCLTIGWNTLANRKSNPAKNALEVNALNMTSEGACKDSLGEDDYTDRKLCTTGAFNGGRPVCQVDAGGPLLCKMATENAYFLHGIASYTQRGCTYKDSYVVYSRPCHAGKWISDTVLSYNDRQA